MTLSFEDCKGIYSHQYVNGVVQEIQNKLELFKYVARIFESYPTNEPARMVGFEFFISNVFKTPTLNYSPIKVQELITLFKNIYAHSKFSKIRSSVLEKIIEIYGPLTQGLQRVNIYCEPRILHDGNPIATTDNRCDIVFYSNDSEAIELAECKSNISNHFPRARLLTDPDMDPKAKQQIEYILELYNNISTKYITPEIFFVCYNTNYKKEMKNVHQRWGYPFFKFINAEEITRSLQARQAV